MEKIIFATGNQDKMQEIREILTGLEMEIQSMKEAGIRADIVEDGQTFEENALIKAKAIAKELHGGDAVVLADDSGLEVDYLDKEPGIYSARYMGEDTSYDIKNQNILDRLAGVPKEQRTARFVCAIAAAFPDGEAFTTRGTIEGYIGWEPAGENGFGYDPIFMWMNTTAPQHSFPGKEKPTEPQRKSAPRHAGKISGKIGIWV